MCQAFENTFLLFVCRDVEKQLQNDDILVRQVTLEMSDIGQPFIPEAGSIWVKPTGSDEIGMNAGNQNVFVVAAIEDGNFTARGGHQMDPPKIVPFFRWTGWCLEGRDMKALRVQA